MGRKRKGKGETGKKGSKKTVKENKMGSSEQMEDHHNGSFSNGTKQDTTPPRRRSARLAQHNGASEVQKSAGASPVTDKDNCPDGMSWSIVNFLSHQYHYTIVPLLLILIMPNFALVIWYMATKCDGSIVQFCRELADDGLSGTLSVMWGSVSVVSPFATFLIISYSLWAIILHKIVPGPRVEGPVTAKGNIPMYKDNGFYCYLITMLAFGLLTFVLKTFYNTSPTIVYDNFGDILACLSPFSMILCLVLYAKGQLAPSTSDCGSSGNIVFDFYWGTELYPRILGIDVKVFTNCRFGMTAWPLLITVFALKSYETYGFVDSMFVSWALQMIYCTKFFWWESGYMHTIDIMLDRAGFYICWGCLVYVPAMYTSVSLYLVTHPQQLGIILSCVIFAAGILSIALNYIADMQKLKVRQTQGNCLIWGRQPEVIHAKYQLESGKTRQSLLLVSGWWGVARHFHYIPELALSLFWSLPAMFDHVMPYLYVIYLTILLVHRTYRDDQKCSVKYKHYWKQYCERVPYKMIPYVF